MLPITPVILSGGSGTRLWPSSRAGYPKQFLKLTSELSLIQQTAKRLEGLTNVSAPIVLANHKHRFLVAEHLSELETGVENIVLEPCSRNTAPAIALAALAQIEKEDTTLLVLPADHLIRENAEFHSVIERARSYCESGKLVTFGIEVTRPATEFGYIKSGNKLVEGVFEIEGFVEKPNLETAEKLLLDQNYSWNSGIFMFKASVYIEQLKMYAPEILQACRKAFDDSELDLGFTKVNEEAFSLSPSMSIDYAVMEHTKDSVVLPVEMGWSDIGSWSALHQVSTQNAERNIFEGDVITLDVENSLIMADKKLVAAIGLDNFVLVESDNAILLASMDRVNDVGSLVAALTEKGRQESETHRKVHRPWGYYDSIEAGEGFQVKRLVVKPGEKLSLQLHHHRSEHWVVVKGVADVVNGDEQFKLNVNESTYIPIGAKHSLANSGEQDLEIIEVQSGSYLEEDDIERFEDVYGRANK